MSVLALINGDWVAGKQIAAAALAIAQVIMNGPYEHPAFSANWVANLSIVRQLHNDLQGRLPPTVFAAAWALGQTLDLATTVQTLLAELSPDSNRPIDDESDPYK